MFFMKYQLRELEFVEYTYLHHTLFAEALASNLTLFVCERGEDIGKTNVVASVNTDV